MSVQSEINRLATAKTAIGTAIAGKGVAVPSGTKLDGMAALIDGIGAGGEDVSAETAEYTSLLTDLETAIDALPDAGSGGGGAVETCNVHIVAENSIPFFMWTDGSNYYDEMGTPGDTGINYIADLRVAKNTVFVIYNASYSNIAATGEITLAKQMMYPCNLFYVSGDGSITCF